MGGGGFDETDYPLGGGGGPKAFGGKWRLGAPVRRHREDDAGNVAEGRQAVVVVEMTAKAFLIAEPGEAEHHRVGILPVREKAEGRRLAAGLVPGIVDIGRQSAG